MSFYTFVISQRNSINKTHEELSIYNIHLQYVNMNFPFCSMQQELTTP